MTAVAVAVSVLAIQAARLLAARSPLQFPASSVVTSRLVPSSAAFGIGCRLTGFCLVSALVTPGVGYPKATGFVTAMMAGMAVFEIISRRYSQGCVRAE